MRYPAIAAELKTMRDEDQAARAHFHATGDFAAAEASDRRTTARLKKIIAEIGWPVASLVGTEGAHHAWLLAQHADKDPAFQRQCLELMRGAAPGEVAAVDIAYLTDRLLVADGKEQEYGTQFVRRGSETAYAPYPIRDPEHVDERRGALGLPSLLEDTDDMNVQYAPPEPS